MRPFIKYCIVLVLATVSPATPAQHEFHLSLVGPSAKADHVDYMLDWVTPSTMTTSALVYGTSATALDREIIAKSAGLVEEGGGNSVACWTAVVPRLSPGETVYYAIKNSTTAGDVQSFTVPKGKGVETWAVVGDLGAPAMKRASAISLPALKTDLEGGVYQGVLNLGDLAYELERSNGQNYMEELESIISKVPMQATVGNHELEHAMAPYFALQNYHRRFQGLRLGAGVVSGSDSNEFYSFSSGLIHFVFINTEVYGAEAFMVPGSDGNWKGDEAARREAAKAQAAWLEYDLSRVDRTKTPYVVICGHRPPFKTPLALSAPGNKFAHEIVPLLSKYQVDLYFSGHEHVYMHIDASKFEGYDLPPIIISGSSGNNEYLRSMKQIKMEGFKEKTFVFKYGYGYLTATEEALEWKWGSTASDSTETPTATKWTLVDEVTIKRRKIDSPSVPEGKPVQEPKAVESGWKERSAASGASSGTDDKSASGSGGSKSTGSSSKSKDSPSPAPVPSTKSAAATSLSSTTAVVSVMVGIVTMWSLV